MSSTHIPSYKKGGWNTKYIIQKIKNAVVDGEIRQVLVPVDDDAVYFVLRIDKDPHARVALEAYAFSVADENAVLASDIFSMLAKTEDAFNNNCPEWREKEHRKIKNKLAKLPKDNFFMRGGSIDE